MNTKQEMCDAGIRLAEQFCQANNIRKPVIMKLGPEEKLFHLATCAFYRPEIIRIMVDKCAARGYGGRAWSWPGYVVDRTPYGVIQHELGHHIDHVMSSPATLFSATIYAESKEKPLTGYLGTGNRADMDAQTEFHKEWFAENFRLFVTNPDLSRALRPKFYFAIQRRNIRPVVTGTWEERLQSFAATPRILNMARKKVSEIRDDRGAVRRDLQPELAGGVP